MARTVNVAGSDAKAAKGSGFDPLPAGKYNVNIFEVSEGTYKEGGANAGRTFLKLHLKVADGQAGANRRLFTNVGDFPRWAPKPGGKDPKGAPNYQFFQFYKSLPDDLAVEFPEGVDGDVELPDLEDLEGALLAVKIKVVKDDYAFKKAKAEGDLDGRTEDDFLKNEVAEFLPAIDPEDLVDESAGSDEFDL